MMIEIERHLIQRLQARNHRVSCDLVVVFGKYFFTPITRLYLRVDRKMTIVHPLARKPRLADSCHADDKRVERWVRELLHN